MNVEDGDREYPLAGLPSGRAPALYLTWSPDRMAPRPRKSMPSESPLTEPSTILLWSMKLEKDKDEDRFDYYGGSRYCGCLCGRASLHGSGQAGSIAKKVCG